MNNELIQILEAIAEDLEKSKDEDALVDYQRMFHLAWTTGIPKDVREGVLLIAKQQLAQKLLEG